MDVLKNGNTALTVDEEGQVLSAITGRAVKKIEYGDDGAFILNAVTGRAEYFIPGASGGGVDTSDATATPEDVFEGLTFYANGKKTGTMPPARMSISSDLFNDHFDTIKITPGRLTTEISHTLRERYYLCTSVDHDKKVWSGKKVLWDSQKLYWYTTDTTLDIPYDTIGKPLEYFYVPEPGKVYNNDGTVMAYPLGKDFSAPGDSGADVTLGMVNDDLNFQPIAFNGTDAVPDGTPIAVNGYYSWNTNTISLVPLLSINIFTQYQEAEYDLAQVASAQSGELKFFCDNLPDGLSLDGSVISGSPNVSGSFSSTVKLSCYGAADKIMTIDFVIAASVPAIPTNFTSNTSIEGYVIDQSSGGGEYPQAWCVFNQNYTTGDYAWWTGNVGVSKNNPGWFSIEVPEAFVPTRIFIMNEIVSPENFKDAVFQGSNNGTNWDDLLTITDSPNTTGLQQYFPLSTTSAYKFFRMLFTASHASGVSVQAFQIYKRTVGKPVQ